LDINKILNELRQQRAELDETIRELERLAAGPDGATRRAVPTQERTVESPPAPGQSFESIRRGMTGWSFGSSSTAVAL
jgi:hypothetical protein